MPPPLRSALRIVMISYRFYNWERYVASCFPSADFVILWFMLKFHFQGKRNPFHSVLLNGSFCETTTEYKLSNNKKYIK